MELNKKKNDICLTCNKFNSCFLRKGVEEAFFWCDEFDNYVQPKATRVAPKISYKTNEAEEALYSGLCTNCEVRKNCVYNEPAKDHLYCETYN